ncbi:hypothetical protein [Sphingosinicella sp. YJ22]|uniref:hypothetical protein n=1 Tax=Sphingosinicella sp. YJ22 TaxID=1104780 RepID=UPI00140B8EBD|nr:hypothetical protein [Sphingosinicella sp. YJ22]
MDPVAAHCQASDVIAEEGSIIIEGPDGVAVTMSPDAAEETAHRLLRAVSEVRASGKISDG